MDLPKDPETPWMIRVASLLVALIVGAIIVYVVFTFGYYASGLAALKEQERQRRESPVPMEFGDANAPQPPPQAPPQQPH